jgi:hypothetical protein
MNKKRPAIPAEIKRRVLIESGHRCAIPTCRYIEVHVHHIVPWEKCESHDYENLIALCPNCHQRADKGEIDRKSLRLYKANLRFVHDKFSNFEIDLLFELYRSEEGATAPLPEYLRLLVGRIEDAGYIMRRKDPNSIKLLNVEVTLESISITPNGREFIESLGLNELV